MAWAFAFCLVATAPIAYEMDHLLPGLKRLKSLKTGRISVTKLFSHECFVDSDFACFPRIGLFLFFPPCLFFNFFFFFRCLAKVPVKPAPLPARRIRVAKAECKFWNQRKVTKYRRLIQHAISWKSLKDIERLVVLQDLPSNNDT